MKGIYEEYIINNNSLFNYLLTYKFRQDHLETFFSAIRSRGGHNNNPTATPFMSAYKRLIVHTDIKRSDRANAALDTTAILYCSSKTTLNNTKDDVNEEELIKVNIKSTDNFKTRNQDYTSAWNLTIFTEDIVRYMAGFVVKKMKKTIKCSLA